MNCPLSRLNQTSILNPLTAAIDKGIELALSQGQIRAVDEIHQDEKGDKRYYWFYYRTDTNLIPARNWEVAPDRNLLLVSDEEIESMARCIVWGFSSA